MIGIAVWRRLAWCAAFALCTMAAGAEAKPQRIVSFNLCADELVLRLADRANIASVTWLAREAGSTVGDLAEGIPLNRGLAEEIIPLAPDLVVAGLYTTRMAVSLLKRLDIPLLELDVPSTLAEVAAQIRTLAAALGEPERGERLIATLDAPPAELADPPVTAVVVRPNGFLAGPGSLVDTVIGRTGMVNLAARMPAGRRGPMPLEAILLGGADLLVVDAAEGMPPSLAHAVLVHPALEGLRRRIRSVALPSRLWVCAGPQMARARALLAEGRAAVEGDRR